MTTIVPPSSSPASKKPSAPGHPWSHQETAALIDAYESKWYSLNRGQLKAHQWEEVSASVAARCHPSPANPHFPPPKTGTQCRHKIEKLRKRYRSEKARPVASLWPYFDRIDRMERGPLPVAVKPPTPPFTDSSDDDDGDENVNGDGEEENDSDDAGEGYRKGVGSGMAGEGEKVGVLMALAREMQRLGEGMARVEKRRMEMMRDVERGWMETEAKRAEMVVEAQRGILDSIGAAFASAAKQRKKAKRAEEL